MVGFNDEYSGYLQGNFFLESESNDKEKVDKFEGLREYELMFDMQFILTKHYCQNRVMIFKN